MSRNRLMIGISVLVVAIIAAIGFPYGSRAWNNHRRTSLEQQCREARSAQKWDELKRLAEPWTTWDAQNGDAWVFLAQAAVGQQQWAEAARCYMQVPDSDAHAVTAMIEVSKLAFSQLDDPLLGVQACERILSIDPRGPGAHKQLIGYYATTLQREKLLQQIRAAVQAQSEPREAYIYFFLLNTLRSLDAVQLTDRWLKTHPDNEALLVARAIQLPESNVESQDAPSSSNGVDQVTARMGRSKAEIIEELIGRFPHNLELLAYKIELEIDTGNTASVANLLAQAPQSARRDNRFWRFSGWLHEMNNEPEAAIKDYRQALELHSVDWTTMNRLAVVERQLQNMSEVQRLTKLVEDANEIRQSLKKVHSAEFVPPPILMSLSRLFRECGEKVIGPALDRRIQQAKGR